MSGDITQSKTDQLWEEWSTRRLPDGRCFDDIFHIDGIPLWRFFYTRVRATDIPPPFRDLNQLEKDITVQRSRDITSRAYFSLFSLALRTALRANEWLKACYAGFSQKTIGHAEKPGILFFDYVRIVKKQDGSVVLYKAEKVRQKLASDGRLEPVIILADPISQNAGRLIGRYDNLLYHYIDTDVRRKSRKRAKELARAWPKLDAPTKHALFSLGRKSAWPVIREEFELLFSFASLYLIAKYFYAFKKAIQENNVQGAYLNCLEGTYDLCLIGALRSLRKGIVYSPHGMAPQGFVLRRHSVKKEMRDGIVFAMSGKEEASQYERRGIPKEQVKITGPMIFDDIVEYMDAAKKHHDKPHKPVVTFFGQPMAQAKFMPHEIYLRYISHILSEIKKVPQARIIIKMHPREDYEEDYRKIVKSLGLADVEIIKQPGTKILYSTIARSDITISFGSTADIESMILGKQVINITGVKGKTAGLTPFEKAITLVDKDAPLAPVLQRLLTDKRLQQQLEQQRDNYIKENYYKIDGKACERVVQLIEETVKG